MPHGMSQWASTMRVGRRMVRRESIGLLSGEESLAWRAVMVSLCKRRADGPQRRRILTDASAAAPVSATTERSSANADPPAGVDGTVIDVFGTVDGSGAGPAQPSSVVIATVAGFAGPRGAKGNGPTRLKAPVVPTTVPCPEVTLPVRWNVTPEIVTVDEPIASRLPQTSSVPAATPSSANAVAQA